MDCVRHEAYTGLKKGVEDTPEKDAGNGRTDHWYQMKRTKSGIKQLIVPGMFFEDMGITYLGPVDGHDIRKLTTGLPGGKAGRACGVGSCADEKGKRICSRQRNNPSRFHGTGPFDDRYREQRQGRQATDTYTDVFSKVLCR